MVKRCIIHIGMHKTGSSSIQNTLYRYGDLPGACYLDLGRPNQSRPLTAMFVASEKKRRKIFAELHLNASEGAEYLRRLREGMVRQLEESEQETVILSGEDLRSLSRRELRTMKEFLAPYTERIEIVAYVRPPKSYMESAFQQIVKGGNAFFDPQKVYPHYRKFEKFDEIFGKENVVFRLFDRAELRGGDVVLDFCEFAKIPIKQKDIVRVNESLTREAVAALYAFWKERGDFSATGLTLAERHKIVRTLRNLPGEKFRFSPALIHPILEKHREDIRWMERRLGRSLAEEMTETEGAIGSEEELLRLAEEVRSAYPKQIRRFLEKASRSSSRKRGEKYVDIDALSARIRRTDPGAFRKVTDEEITEVIRTLFSVIGMVADKTEDTVRFPRLGTIQVRGEAGERRLFLRRPRNGKKGSAEGAGG